MARMMARMSTRNGLNGSHGRRHGGQAKPHSFFVNFIMFGHASARDLNLQIGTHRRMRTRKESNTVYIPETNYIVYRGKCIM